MQALAKAGNHPQLVRDAVDYLVAVRTPDGGWADTQATVQALRAILAVNSAGAKGEVTVRVNGKQLDAVRLNGDGVVKSLDCALSAPGTEHGGIARDGRRLAGMPARGRLLCSLVI